METKIKASSLDVGYKNRIVLGDVEFALNKGEILCLMGPNGSGKSTIIKTIIQNTNKLGGSIFINNKNIESMSLKEKAQLISVVLTERIHPELMTAEEIVSSGRYPYTNFLGKLEEKDYEAISNAINIVGANSLRKKLFNELSDGQKQRIMLARAICQESEIMILDEPTSFLDIRYKIEILGILRKLAREFNKAIILSLHEIDLIPKVADKVLQINGEKKYSYGNPEDIISDESIMEAFSLTEGRYSTLIGNIELAACLDKPKVFVLGGCGNGIDIYRMLNKNNISFTTGVLFENDIDYVVSKSLACENIIAKPFEEISDEKIEQAKRLIDECEIFINSGTILRGNNSKNGELLLYALDKKKNIIHVSKEKKDSNSIDFDELQIILKEFNSKQ